MVYLGIHGGFGGGFGLSVGIQEFSKSMWHKD
jgi:hypothetical protein